MENHRLTTAHFRDNPHVMMWPEGARKKDNVPVSNTTVVAHKTATGVIATGIPASTLPSLIEKPGYYAAGAGVGALAGLLYTVSRDSTKITALGYFGTWNSFLKHTVGIQTWAKSVLGTAVVGGSSGNAVLAQLLNSSVTVAVVEGFVGGFIAGKETTEIALNLLDTSNESGVSDNQDEAQGLNV